MKPHRIAPVAAACFGLLTVPAVAHGSAEGPGTPQAIAAHAEFLSSLPAPPTGAGSVCVIDSGVDTDTDLGPALTTRSAFDNGTPNDVGALSDDGTELSKHGTYVAGVIASQIDGIGTSGIWPAAKVMSRRVFGGPTSGTTAQRYINAITWCEQESPHLRVINLSLAGLNAALIERSALQNKIAEVRGSPYYANVVAAAGNSASSFVGYPGSETGVFAVGATDETGLIAPFSNRGIGLDLSAFGTEVCLTTSYGTRLAVGRGTSFAAPVVSAVIDALRSYDPGLGPDEAERLLVDNAAVTPSGKALDAARAFEAAGIVTPRRTQQTFGALPCEAPSAAPEAVAAGGELNAEGEAELTMPTRPLSGENPAVAPHVQAGADSDRTPMIDVPVHVDAGLTVLKPNAPVFRSIAVRKGILTVKVAGRRSGDIVLFRVTRKIKRNVHRSGQSRAEWRTTTRSYSRTSSTLRVKSASWAMVSVRLHRSGIGTSDAATAHPGTDLYLRRDMTPTSVPTT